MYYLFLIFMLNVAPTSYSSSLPYSLYKPKKSVRFQPIVHIKEIPNRDQLVVHELWWSRQDFSFFMKQSQSEIQMVLMRFPHIRSPKMARHMLYQPESLRF